MNKQNNDYIFGLRPIIEYINSGKQVDKIIIKKGLSNELFRELFTLIKEYDIPFQSVPIEKLNRITRKNHQGIIAFTTEIEYSKIDLLLPILYESGITPLLLILDGITDVRNFGAIARSAECAGADAIIIPTKNSARANADAIKTSAGALFKIPVCRTDNLKDTITFLKNSGIEIFAATEKAESLFNHAKFKNPLAIIMGSEDKGISNELIKIADHLIKIPILGSIQSLNVSVASGILLYEVIKQRNFN